MKILLKINHEYIISYFRNYTLEKFWKIVELPSDFNLEYRTVYNNNGFSFHDRYLILRYNINNSRVWSIGTSYNSVCKSHHIIQIVDNPTKIEQVFEDLWEKINIEECLILGYNLGDENPYVNET